MAVAQANHTREVQSHRDAPAVVHDGKDNPHARDEIAQHHTTASSLNKELGKLPSNPAARDAIPPMQLYSGDKPLTGGAGQDKPEGKTPYAVPKLRPEDKALTEAAVQRAGQGMAYDLSHEGNMGPKGGMGTMTHGDQYSDATSNRIQGLLGNAADRGSAEGGEKGSAKAVEDMTKRINDSFQKAQKEDKKDYPHGPEKDFKLTGQTLTRADVQIVEKKNHNDHADTSYRLNQ